MQSTRESITVKQVLRIAFGVLITVTICSAMTGCAVFVSSATGKLASDLTSAISNNDDLATVETGAPAYLLMIDGLVEGNPDSEALLRAGATMYSMYSGVFVKDRERAKLLTGKALAYGVRGLCERRSEACNLKDSDFDSFTAVISGMTKSDVPALYALGSAWAGWIQARRDDWNAVAQIARVEAIMNKILELDESYQLGSAHVYIGTLATLVPPAMGGRPEVAKTHFERALVLSRGDNLMFKVLYAQQYARLVFDRELHDRLLNEVIGADPQVPGLVLVNTLAQKQAHELLETAADYF